MKKSALAARVFEAMDPQPLALLGGGNLIVPISDLAGLSLIPWFCDPSVQWAFRLSMPGKVLPKSLIRKVNDSFVTATEAGAVLIGVPGDGIEPSTVTLVPLAEAVAKAAEPGMTVELAAANLGFVKRDRETAAETATPHGNQRYVGVIDRDGRWCINQSTPPVTTTDLGAALRCGRMVATKGPWTVEDQSDAYPILMHWLTSPQANINPAAVKRFITFQDGRFANSDPGMDRKLCGLGLGFFRHRFAAGPFRWEDSGPLRHPLPEIEQVARDVSTSPA